MKRQLRLMAVLAHPDDESLGFGGTLAKYAAEGVLTTLVCATRGEQGWTGDPAAYPGPDALGRIRETELLRAASVLGIHDVIILGYPDGHVCRVNPGQAVSRLARELRSLRPDVVVTFGPDGVYGHPDHIAISQLTTSAIVCAADSAYDELSGLIPHRVAKLYYRIWTPSEQARFEAAIGKVSINVAGHLREWLPWPDWAISARLDTEAFWPRVLQAVMCHQSQLGSLPAISQLPPAAQCQLWGPQHYYRALATCEAHDGIEHDLFAGLRE